MTSPKDIQAVRLEPAGFNISKWCPLAGISRARFYTLPPELTPRTVQIGKRRIVIESPREYLHRIAQQQAA
jgi:hypothetical protein